MELETFTFVLPRRGAHAAAHDDDYPASLEETRRLTQDDPAMEAGRMTAEVMTWLTRKGALA